MKKRKKKIVRLICYDYPMALLVDRAGVDAILVGDSVGMVALGMENTMEVTLEDMIRHCRAVARGAKHAFVIGDMPFLSYQTTPAEAVKNAGRFYKEAGVDAIKLEGGRRILDMIKAIVNAGMVVCGHIGLTPQSSGQIGGFKAQGLTAESAHELIKDARVIQEAGAALLLLEAVPPEVGQFIAKDLKIPVYGIGAGPHVDGQLLIVMICWWNIYEVCRNTPIWPNIS
jgi:3-methyl-2-oxobutanoate hydroxymethyltransferase